MENGIKHDESKRLKQNQTKCGFIKILKPNVCIIKSECGDRKKTDGECLLLMKAECVG